MHPLHSNSVVFRIASETKSHPLASLVGSFGIVSRPWWVSEGSSGTLVGPLGIPWGPLKGSLGFPWWVIGVLGVSLGCLGGAVGITARLAAFCMVLWRFLVGPEGFLRVPCGGPLGSPLD